MFGGNYSVATIDLEELLVFLFQIQLQLLDNLLSMYVIIEIKSANDFNFFPIEISLSVSLMKSDYVR